MDQKGVQLCLSDICDTFEKTGPLDEEDISTFKSRLFEFLKMDAEIIKVTGEYVLVETDDMRVELLNNRDTTNMK